MSNEVTREEAISLAVLIAGTLFINGSGQEAIRLRLELPDGEYGGGWGQQPVIDLITEILLRR